MMTNHYDDHENKGEDEDFCCCCEGGRQVDCAMSLAEAATVALADAATVGATFEAGGISVHTIFFFIAISE